MCSKLFYLRLLQILLATTIVLHFACNTRQDQADALNAAEKIHAQIKNVDFQSIYRESDDTFKAAGDESKFVEHMKRIHEVAGSLKAATPIAYQSTLDSNVGRKHILSFNLEFERGPGKERMVFTRSGNGQMRLWDLVIEPKLAIGEKYRG
jgi:hypothetical protein